MWFRSSKRNRLPQVSEQDKGKVEKAHEEADPTTYSSLPVKHLKQVRTETNTYGYRVMEDPEGNKYIDLSGKRGEPGATEMAVASLLKGIVNVSDIIAVDDGTETRHYSKIMEINKTHTMSVQEIMADIAVFCLIFNDSDHFLFQNHRHDQNIITEKEKTRAIYFDFGESKYSFWDPLSYIHKRTTEALEALDESGFGFLTQKLHQLQKQLEGESGFLFVKSVVENSGRKMEDLFTNGPKNTDELMAFYHELQKRVTKSLAEIDARMSYKKVA